MYLDCPAIVRHRAMAMLLRRASPVAPRGQRTPFLFMRWVLVVDEMSPSIGVICRRCGAATARRNSNNVARDLGSKASPYTPIVTHGRNAQNNVVTRNDSPKKRLGITARLCIEPTRAGRKLDCPRWKVTRGRRRTAASFRCLSFLQHCPRPAMAARRLDE